MWYSYICVFLYGHTSWKAIYLNNKQVTFYFLEIILYGGCHREACVKTLNYTLHLQQITAVLLDIQGTRNFLLWLFKYWKSWFIKIVVAHFISHVRLFATTWTAACQPSLSFTISQSLLRLTSIELIGLIGLILCCPLLLLPLICPRIRVISIESVLHIRWPKYWSFSFTISPFNEYSGLTSFRTDWSNSHIHTWLLEKQ